MFRNLVGENLGDENLHSATNAIKIVKIWRIKQNILDKVTFRI